MSLTFYSSQFYFGNTTYLFLNLISILFPFVLSFDKKVHFYTYWCRLFLAIIVGAVSFLIWDEWFTRENVWSFNPHYIIGIYIGKLPLEEWLFFICIPFSCFFIYECLKTYFKNYLHAYSTTITFFLISIFLLIGITHYQKIYTFITFMGTGVLLLFHFLLFKKKYLGYFYMMWIIHLIPLFIINGVLTGLPVVSYNNAENMGIRIGTVPLEDAFYSMFLLLINLTVYEGLLKFKRRT